MSVHQGQLIAFEYAQVSPISIDLKGLRINHFSYFPSQATLAEYFGAKPVAIRINANTVGERTSGVYPYLPVGDHGRQDKLLEFVRPEF